MHLSVTILKSVKLYSGNFHFWENQIHILSLFFILHTTKTLDITCKRNMKRLKGGKKTDQQWTSGPSSDMMSCQGFLFFIYLRLGAEEASNLEISMSADQKKANKSPLFLAKRPGKEQPRKIEHLDNNCSTSAKQHRKYGDHPIPTSDDRSQLGSLDFYPHKTVMRCPQHHTRAVPDSVREGQVPNQDFHLCQLVTSPPIHTQNSVSGEYRRNLGFLSLPAIMRCPYPSPLG